MCKTESGKLLNNTGSPAWDSVMTQRGGVGRRETEGRDILIYMIGPRCGMAETNTKL